MRGSLNSHWWLPLDTVSYMSFKEASEANVGDFYVSEVPCESHRPTVANYFRVELTVLKGMTQELVALFGLTLPVS
jgi:hypothetical protein